MISRILVLLIGLPACVLAEPYNYPGHIEFSTQDNRSNNVLLVRLAATTASSGAVMTVDRIEQESGVLQLYTTIAEGALPAFGDVFVTQILVHVDRSHYGIEFHARPDLRTTDEYTLLDREQVAFVPVTAVIPSNPSVFEAVSIVTAAAPGCGPVLASHVEGGFDPWAGVGVVVPTDYIHTVTLEYAQWPCPVGGSTDPSPVRVSLGPDTSGRLGVGSHTVRVVHGTVDEGLPPAPDSRVLTFLVRGDLPSRIAGTWFNENHLGQGVQIQVIPQGQVLASWYTFDDAGTPAVIIAQGPSSGLSAELDAVILTGGQFPTAATTTGVPQPWGTLELQFIDCNHATMTWDADRAGFADGTLALQRLSSQQDAECDAPSDLTGGAWQVIDPVPADPV